MTFDMCSMTEYAHLLCEKMLGLRMANTSASALMESTVYSSGRKGKEGWKTNIEVKVISLL